MTRSSPIEKVMVCMQIKIDKRMNQAWFIATDLSSDLIRKYHSINIFKEVIVVVITHRIIDISKVQKLLDCNFHLFWISIDLTCLNNNGWIPSGAKETKWAVLRSLLSLCFYDFLVLVVNIANENPWSLKAIGQK